MSRPARPARPGRPPGGVVVTPPGGVVVTPPATRAAALADPEPPFSSEVPPEITDPRQRAEHLTKIIHAHVVLREKTYYDSGRAVVELMRLKHVYGANDIKELVIEAGLPMSHMTAQKWMMIARVFDRATAVEHKAEKCYALIRYAARTGRREEEAARILASDELLRGVKVRAKAATAGQVYDALELLRAEAAPGNTRDDAERAAVAAETQEIVRELGLTGARAAVNARGQIQLTLSLRAAQNLRAVLPRMIARWGRKALREDPEWSAPLLRAGWKPRGSPLK